MMRRHAIGYLILSLVVATALPACIPFVSHWWFNTTVAGARTDAVPALESRVPHRFSEWQSEPQSPLAVIAPDAAREMQKTYTKTVARVYRHTNGQRVMLMLAYGQDQIRQKTEAHQPEYCYLANGFAVEKLGLHTLTLSDLQLPVTRLAAQRQSRYELISYWFTLDGKAIAPGWQRKWQQIRLGLAGRPSGGMLVRISSLTPTRQLADAQFISHQMFISDWLSTNRQIFD